MKTTEIRPADLMIGDWIVADDMELYKVYATFPDAIIANDNNGQEKIIPFDGITPIPLTAEILEKNGFGLIEACSKPKYAKYVCCNVLVLFENDKTRLVIKSILSKEITHVHELQHALRLCGIEKEITI